MIGVEVMENSFVLAAIEIDAPHRNGHHFRARSFDGFDHLRIRAVLTRADHQARAELAPRDDQRLRVGDCCRRNQIGVRHCDLASAHEVDDLDRIVALQLQLRKGRAVAQNGSIALDYDCPRVEVEGAKKVRHRRSSRKTPLVAVHGNYDRIRNRFRHNTSPRHTCER